MKIGNHIIPIPLLLSGILLFSFHTAQGISGISYILPAPFGFAPVLSNIEHTDLIYSRGSGEIIITKTLTISDADSKNLWSASISITSGYNASEDVLTFKSQNGISGKWNKTTGILTLSGAATVSRYQTALRSITYKNTNTVNPSKQTRVVSFMVNDGLNKSNLVTRNIVILSPNVAPTLTNIETITLQYCPGSGVIPVTSTLNVIDPDNLNLASAIVQIISGYTQDEDFLRFTDQNNIIGSWESSTGTLTLSGDATVASYQTALRSIRYENINLNAPDAGNHNISFLVSDGTDKSNTATRSIMVNPRVSAILSGSTSICMDDITSAALSIALSGTPPWAFTLLRNDQIEASFKNITQDHNPFTFQVKKEGTYRIQSVADANCVGDTIGSGTARILVKPYPTAVISGIDTICQGETTELLIVLTGTAPWSISYLLNGSGQTTVSNILTPDYMLKVKDPGTYNLVSVEDDICKGKVSGTGVVRHYQTPTAVISGDTNICEHTPANLRVTLTGTPPWHFSYRHNAGNPVELYNISASPTFFASNNAGTYILVEVYDKHCKGTISGNAIIDVIPSPDVSMSGLAPAYNKQSTDWIPLAGNPSGGLFSGPGVIPYDTSWFLIPALAPIGTQNIVYKYRVAPGSCYGYDTAVVRIIEAEAFIEFENDRIHYCRNDHSFVVTGSNLSGITGTFSISGGAGMTDHHNNTATVRPSELNANKYTITYTYFDGTNLHVEEDFEVENSPKARFHWATECFQEGQPIAFTNTSEPVFGYFTDTSYNWRIQTSAGFVTDSAREIAPAFSEPGNYKIELAVQNSYGCVDTMTRTFTLRPTISLADTSYYEDFETRPISWQSGIADAKNPANSWELGNPLHGFSGAASGSNCWYSDIPINAAAPREQSSVTSPCFDFRGTERPMLKARIWRLFSDTRDGANFQASTDSGKSWIPVGELNDGVQWFNAYYGNPGAQSAGWTATKDAGWTWTRHSLDAFKNQSKVQFRFAYSAIGTALENDGIAFDDIWILERNRTALIEHFTNSSDFDCVGADSTLDAFIQEAEQNAIDLQYHTSNPANDPFYDDNQVIPTTRQFYYGLSDVPYALLDGGSKSNHRFDYIVAKPFDPNAAIVESLQDSKFDIRTNAHVSDNYLDIETEIFSREAIPLTELSVRIAVIERVVEGITGINGDTLFRSVVKTMLPSAAGTTIYKAWGAGESSRIDESWEIKQVYDPDELRIVVFVQNESTKEIYQAAMDTIGVPTGINYPPQWRDIEKAYAVYPNPAERQVFIRFGQETEEPITLKMFDNTGSLVYTAFIPEGILIAEFPLKELHGGLYILHLTANHQLLGTHKLTILK